VARAARLARLDERRVELEAEYAATLIAALQRTAAGKWGLFGHTDDRAARAAIAPVIDSLGETGEAIDKARAQLGLEPFDLQQQFLASRGKPGAEAVGEPKQAQAWLDRLRTAGHDID
jgi:hypothetical protein